ncbi:MAG: GNAT family N-acetyltransferase [Candidatus Aenigmarchaeota archaeon]|nr:GNAT family N-acetyltransferase [Candidatus Aenigmarchaeota archaeon]
MKVSIRKVKHSDIEAISRINIDNWRHAFRGIYSRERIAKSTSRWTPEFVANRMKSWMRTGREAFVAIHKGKVVGFVIYKRKNRIIKISALYVDRKMQRKRVGSALLVFAERKTRAKTYTIVSASRKHTISFYEKMGYKKLRTVRRKKTGDIDIVMIKRK